MSPFGVQIVVRGGARGAATATGHGAAAAAAPAAGEGAEGTTGPLENKTSLYGRWGGGMSRSFGTYVLPDGMFNK